MVDAFYEVRNVLSQLFGVPSSWFTGPQFITNLIIPYVLAVAFYSVLFRYKVKIFKAGIVNWVLSFVAAFFTIPVIVINPYVAVFFSVFAVVLFYGGGGISLKRLLLAGGVAAFAWFLESWLIGFLAGVFV